MNTFLPEESMLADRYAASVQPLATAETDPFFYTRLMARRSAKQAWQIPVKPAWVLALLFALLLANGWILFVHKADPVQAAGKQSQLSAFAVAYDLNTYSNY